MHSSQTSGVFILELLEIQPRREISYNQCVPGSSSILCISSWVDMNDSRFILRMCVH
jgi:hypothetical protein